MNKIRFLSLFSMVLVSACVTVPRIDRKDSKNNQFSQQLQDWMAVKHPQKIDTTTEQSRSDTTWGPIILVDSTSNINFALGDSVSHNDWDVLPPGFSWTFIHRNDTIDSLYTTGRNKGSVLDAGEYGGGLIFSNDSILIGLQNPCKPKAYIQYVYIHDTITKLLVNESQIKGFTDQLGASRDSTATFTLKYTQEKSAGLIKLFIAIGLFILLIVSIILYFQKK